MSDYDVVVVGAGNAALSAAMAARENGARVLILEKASEEEKGGNSYFTAGGFRFCHTGIDDVATDVLTDLSPAERDQTVLPVHDREIFYEVLMKVTHHQSDETMAWQLIDGSRQALVWLRSHGIRFIPMFGHLFDAVLIAQEWNSLLIENLNSSPKGLTHNLPAKFYVSVIAHIFTFVDETLSPHVDHDAPGIGMFLEIIQDEPVAIRWCRNIPAD